MKLDDALNENVFGPLDPAIVAVAYTVIVGWGLAGIAKKLVDWYYSHQMKALNKEKAELEKELEHKKRTTENMELAHTIIATQHDDPELEAIESELKKVAFPMRHGGYIDVEHKAFQKLLRYVEAYKN